jgi:hypothetical protein
MKPIAMKCTPEQWESIKHHFEGWNTMEVKFSPNQRYLVNNHCGSRKQLATLEGSILYGRVIFEQWNADTFLEYCDIKPEFVLPEKWAVEITDENKETLYNWAKSQPDYNIRCDVHWESPRLKFCVSSLWDFSYCTFRKEASIKQSGYTIITFEQFQQHVLKQKTHMKLTVNINQVLKIHEIACSSWKSLIADYLKRIDVNQNITFSEQEIRGMFDAATKDQKPVLESIFGTLSKPIEWDKIKTGSKVMIKYTELNCGKPTVDYSQPVDVVFYKTPYGINYRGVFFLSHFNYITFHQNGNFILYTSDKNTDCIVEVLEY